MFASGQAMQPHLPHRHAGPRSPLRARRRPQALRLLRRELVHPPEHLRCAFKIGTAIISYFSKKQGHISLSTFEAEISAGTLAACEAVHLRSLLASLGYK